MDDIKQERSNERATFKLNKRFKQTSLNKKFANTLRNLWSIRPLKNKQYSISEK